jgi:catechol 2,3-dioxygenase-like lactoylglutathione lyase family enzyme
MTGNQAAPTASWAAMIANRMMAGTPTSSDWVDRVDGLQGTRADIAMMHTADGHGRLELARYQHPPAVGPDPRSEPADTRGMGRIMFNVDNIDDVVERLQALGQVVRPYRCRHPEAAPVDPPWRASRRPSCTTSSRSET